jgi:hypothetical protein
MLRTEETYHYSDPYNPTATTETDYGQYGTPVVVEGIKGSTTLYRKEYTYNGLGLLTEYHQYDQYSGAGSYKKLYSIQNEYDDAGNLDISILREGPVDTGELIKALDYDPVDQALLSVIFCDPGSSLLMTHLFLKNLIQYFFATGQAVEPLSP